MRRTRRLLLGFAVLFVLLASWLLASESGLRFLVGRALPGDGSVRIAEIDGTLWSGPSLRGLALRSPGLHLDLREARAELALWPLLAGAIRLDRLEARGLRVERRTRAPAQAASGAAVVLPDLAISALVVREIEVVDAGDSWPIERLAARVALARQRIRIEALELTAAAGSARGALELDLARALPLRAARLEFAATFAERDWQGGLEARTERGRTGLTLALRQPLLAAVAIAELRDARHWNAQIELPAQRTPDQGELAASLQLQAEDERFALRGNARYGAFAAQALDLQARLDDGGLQFAPSRITLTAPQGEIMLSGQLPFAADAPIALQLATERLAFAAVDAPQLQVSGTLALTGTRAEPAFAPALTLVRSGWPQAQVTGRVLRVESRWRAEALGLVAAHSRLELDGPLFDTLEGEALQLSLQRFDPSLLLPQWPGAIDAQMHWRGHYARGFVGELSIDELSGQLRARPLRGAGVLGLERDVVASADARIDAGRSSLRLQRAAAAAPLQFDLDSPDLSDLAPDWRGRAQVQIVRAADWQWRAQLEDWRTPAFALRQLQGEGRLGEAADAMLAQQLLLRGLDAGSLRIERAQLAVAGQRAAHRVDFELESGVRQLQLALAGSLDAAGGWRGQISALDLLAPEWRAALVAPAALTWQDARLTLARTCVAGAEGDRVCAHGEHGGARSEMALELVALDLRPWFALLAADAPFSAEARVSGSADLVLVAGELASASALLESAEGALRVAARPDLDLGYRDFRFDLRVADGVGRWQGGATLRPEGRVESSGELARDAGGWGYSGRIAADVHRFDAIEAFTSQLAAPRGDLSGELQLRGHVGAPPQWSGALAITAFAAELPELGLQIADGALAIAAVPGGVIVRGAITSGDGQLVLDGGRGAAADARWHFALNGSNAVLADTPALRLVLGPALTLEQRERGWHLGGSVEIPEARIDAAQLSPPSAASADVVIVDEDANSASDVVPWTADVSVRFGKNARLLGFGFDGHIGGALRLRQRSDSPASAQGQLQLSGRYAAYGQRLSIRRGRLLYANSPLDEPTLDIEAERKAGSAVAGVRVTGTARNPQTAIYARPSLPESEALALLVTGRSLRGMSGVDRERLSHAALALGSIGGDLLASGLGAEIGITGDAARGTEAFTIGKYLTPKLFIGYGIGLARRGSVFIVRYLVRDDVEFEATSGEQARASLNYVIER